MSCGSFLLLAEYIENILSFICSSGKMRFSSIVAGVLAILPVFTSGLTISDTTGRALNAYSKRSTVSDIVSDIENAASCSACEVWHNWYFQSGIG